MLHDDLRIGMSMKKKNNYGLTPSELVLMQILWDAARPLSRSEIFEVAFRDPENPLFAFNSFHVMINDLIDKDYLSTLGAISGGRKNARRFAPNISRNEYFARQITSTENYKPDDIPDIVSALFKCSKDSCPDSVLDRMEQLIRQKRR